MPSGTQGHMQIRRAMGTIGAAIQMSCYTLPDPGCRCCTRPTGQCLPCTFPMKQVIVVNRSLALPKGKLAAQVAHAAVGAFVAAAEASQARWLQVGMPKIVVYAIDADALVQLETLARQRQIPACLVRDAGRTVIPAGTITCLGLGPATAEVLDPLTGALPLV
jgi:PTH2 family peptidyl-tRNA hydrolase